MNKNCPDLPFYKSTDSFFQENAALGLTYDDVSLATAYSSLSPQETHLETKISERISLSIPILSADMDTVTDANMAIAMALNGGLGLIHYNMPEIEQIRAVARVKNNIHGLIQDPIKVAPDETIADVLAMIEAKKYSFHTFPVVDKQGILLGLLTGRVVKNRYRNKTVYEAMTPREQLFTIAHKELGQDPIAIADRFFTDHMGIHKLLVVDEGDHLCGLFTLSDIEQLMEEARARVKPVRDDKFRLMCGAAINTFRTKEGALDRNRILNHVENLLAEGLDIAAISTAHGHTEAVGQVIRSIRDTFPSLPIIAGNVTSASGAEFLAQAGASTIKVGQGPGSICTTRIVAGVGIPQLTALYVVTKELRKKGIFVLADGGITKSGDIVKALTMADAVICGNLLAGCQEAPGNVIEINGKCYKQYRGMGSNEAMLAGSAARYGHYLKNTLKAAAEGIEALKEVSGPLTDVLGQLAGGLQSGMGYLGAKNLKELRKKARFIRLTEASQRESIPHDVIEIKTTKEGN